MFRKRNQEKNDSGVIVLKKTEPGTCGGTDATQDTKAPTEILSESMILFDVTSALNEGLNPPPSERTEERLGYISAFAAPAGSGVFLFLEKASDFQRRGKKDKSWAFVKDDIFPSLVRLVRECGIAEHNGSHSTTHGLPENFGGSIDIRYASGETISISNNQSPLIDHETAARIAALFEEAMNGAKVSLPKLTALRELRFEENRTNGGFTKAALKILPDGTGLNEKQSRYDDGQVYESAKEVDADTISAIKANMDETGILAWADLPDNAYAVRGDKTVTFMFEDGSAIAVRAGKILPEQLADAFFKIELEMTTKH